MKIFITPETKSLIEMWKKQYHIQNDDEFLKILISALKRWKLKTENKPQYRFGWEAYAIIYEDLTGQKAVKDFRTTNDR